MIRRFLYTFLLIPVVAFSDVENDQLLQLQTIAANTGWLLNIKGEYSRILQDILTKNTSLEIILNSLLSNTVVNRDNLSSLFTSITSSVAPNIYQVRNVLDGFSTWWNRDVSRHVDRTMDQFYYFLNDEADPYELNERTIYELVNNPGDTFDRKVDPFLRSNHIDNKFKDYFEYYSNSHLDILAANNKFLADIALSLSPTNSPKYYVELPSTSLFISFLDSDRVWGYYDSYIASGNTYPIDFLTTEFDQFQIDRAEFDDPYKAIISLLIHTYELQTSYTFPLMVVITNQQAILSRLAPVDTSFTNQLAHTVDEDLADPGKFDTELDSILQNFDIEKSSFYEGFQSSFSAPSSESISFQLLENLSLNLPNFSDFEFPTIDIDISVHRRLFEILRKCMIAFWGVLSFTFWLFVFKAFVYFISLLAKFFGPQVSDGLGRS